MLALRGAAGAPPAIAGGGQLDLATLKQHHHQAGVEFGVGVIVGCLQTLGALLLDLLDALEQAVELGGEFGEPLLVEQHLTARDDRVAAIEAAAGGRRADDATGLIQRR